MSTLPDLPDLKNLTRAEARDALAALGVEGYRGEQVFRWVHGRGAGGFAEMTDLGKALREQLTGRATIGQLAVDAEQVSVDGTRKLRLRTDDGRFIESVLIPDGDAGSDSEEPDDVAAEATELDDADRTYGSPLGDFDGGRSREAPSPGLNRPRPKLTQCISSQVGCALDCTFCATALLGFGRNLTAGEIVDQVYRARALLSSLPKGDPTRRAGAERVTNLVFMGMGEPLHNLPQVARSLEILTDPMGMALSPRRITVSTAGMVAAIDKLGALPVRPNLAISLNATTDEVRDRVMPINKKWNLGALLAAVRRFPLERRRRVTFEYVLLDGVNDSRADARRLPELLRGIPSKVNLIPWNPHPGSDFRRPSDEAIRAFQEEVRARGLAVYVRKSRGRDIDAACGQLAAKAARPTVDGAPLVELRR